MKEKLTPLIKKQRALPKIIQPLNFSKLPDTPGIYYWNIWKEEVVVDFRSKRSKVLEVKPSARRPLAVPITLRIAGKFRLVKPLGV